MTRHPHILGVILAGGGSRRMGGTDKSLSDLAGKPMLAHVVERFAPQVSRLILNANGDATRFDVFALDVVADSHGAGNGPLAGILAAMLWAEMVDPAITAIASVSTDVPFLPVDLVAELERSRGGGSAVAEFSGRLHPAIGIWPLIHKDAAARALTGEQRSLKAFAKAVNATKVSFPPVTIGGYEIDPFFNANTPEELEEARRFLTGKT